MLQRCARGLPRTSAFSGFRPLLVVRRHTISVDRLDRIHVRCATLTLWCNYMILITIFSVHQYFVTIRKWFSVSGIAKSRYPQRSVPMTGSDVMASGNCFSVHAAVGWTVTLQRTIRRVSCSIAINTQSSRNIAVTTTQKSRVRTYVKTEVKLGIATNVLTGRCLAKFPQGDVVPPPAHRRRGGKL
jgi:hypothetical protein